MVRLGEMDGGQTLAVYHGDTAQIRTVPPGADVDAMLAGAIREVRDRLLAECDYLMLPDYPIRDAERELWRLYRQALRDIPDQPDFPHTTVWPTRPEST